jgi:hypothetical protein
MPNLMGEAATGAEDMGRDVGTGWFGGISDQYYWLNYLGSKALTTLPVYVILAV